MSSPTTPGTNRAPADMMGCEAHQGDHGSSAGELSEAIVFGQLFGRHAQAIYSSVPVAYGRPGPRRRTLTSITFLEAWRHQPPRQPSWRYDNTRMFVLTRRTQNGKTNWSQGNHVLTKSSTTAAA